MIDYCYRLVEGFLSKSMPAVRALAKSVQAHKEEGGYRRVTFLQFVNGKKISVHINGVHFYLRGSVEYTNPQVTAEEIQGIVGIRLLQTCVNYYMETDMQELTFRDYPLLCEELKKVPYGYVLPFLLNTDDVEADRYSINPLKQSLIDSGQSAFPVANIKTDRLYVDKAFVEKYEGTLISKKEAELIAKELLCHTSYMDFVDTVKFQQLEELSKLLGINLNLYTLRMPLSTLQAEKKGALLHYIISQAHLSYNSVKNAYNCMGRSITKHSTLLTVPHSKKGYGSKRAAHGKIYFNNNNNNNVNSINGVNCVVSNVAVKYQPTLLYPNGIDPKDVSLAQGEDDFVVKGEDFLDYSYVKTPSSPQFFLYALASPEDAALWHGIGAFAASHLLQSYLSAYAACREGELIPGLREKFNLQCKTPLQFNLVPQGMWRNPSRQNIDASIGSITDINSLISRDMWLEQLAIEDTKRETSQTS
ncbi:MAG: hypothetical protein FWC14_04705 [Candidatus Bathyarchaeota archaeon]|uniref:hypothetical protein n=1 Tax=Candidatus Bathycorpusculum sp. TaxID=2994959 RepID=UPI002832B5A4|nr:hypothetical protein [Candidatus Termiticorpusculum sp.]MCL2292374.1 hypothetical protein [Candidatus Termiticorpusculum sp.]